MRRWHAQVRRNIESPEGVPVHAYGARAGYWPCIKGWFVQITFAIWRIEIWYGYEGKS